MEIRVQVAYHFKIDPAKLSPGLVRLPEQIIRTVSVGDELITEKVATECVPPTDRAVLISEIEKQVSVATRTARPAGSTVPTEEAASEEMSAF